MLTGAPRMHMSMLASPPVGPTTARFPKILLYIAGDPCGEMLWQPSRIAETLLDSFPGADVLVVTGSPEVRRPLLPKGVDLIRLPGLDMIEPARYETRFLSRSSETLRSTRRELLQLAVSGFDPDLVIVGGRPAEPDAEFLEAIEILRSKSTTTRVVLAISDVPDEVDQDRALSQRGRDVEAVERLFDEVWICGAEDICDRVRDGGFTAEMASRSHYCGYLLRPAPGPRRTGGAPRILLASGWESSGCELIEAFLEGLSGLTYQLAISTTVVLGPRIPAERRRDLRQRYGRRSGVEFHDHDASLEHHYAQADVVVSAPDYDPICEILSCGIPSLLVLTGAATRAQALRARRLAEFDLFELVGPDGLKPYSLIAKALDRLESGMRSKTPPCLSSPDLLRARARALLGDAR